MMRRIAVVGDKLDNDGEICSYDGPQFLVHGHQVALIDGAAYCPVCKTTGYIAKDGGPRRMNFFTSEIAAHDDVVVCGCSEHPRIFAMLAGEAWYDDMAESLAPSRRVQPMRLTQRQPQTLPSTLAVKASIRVGSMCRTALLASRCATRVSSLA